VSVIILSTESEILDIQDYPKARLPAEVIEGINERLQKNGLLNRIEPYWICQLRNGAFPTKLNKLMRKKALPAISKPRACKT
jgi:hypothetical protein